MVGLMRYAAVVLILGAALVNAEYKPAYQERGGVNAKVTETVTISFHQALNFGHQLDQNDGNFLQFAEKGLTAADYGVGFEAALGNLGNLNITGGGELVVVSRTMDDSTITKDYLEVRPTGLLNLTFPFAGVFKAQYFSRFERRIIRRPFQVSKFRYTSHTRLSSDGILPLRTGFFLFYEGNVQKGSSSMSRWGGGLTMEPVKNLLIEGGYSRLWRPTDWYSNIFPIFAGVSYTLDFTR